MGVDKELDFGGKAGDTARNIRVPKEAAAAWGITGWGRMKLGIAEGEVEGGVSLCFVLVCGGAVFFFFSKYFHRYCLGPKFNGKKKNKTFFISEDPSMHFRIDGDNQ